MVRLLKAPNSTGEHFAAKPVHLDHVLKGKDAHPDIGARADEVLEMENIKHHFDRVVRALRGIEC
jgi:cob(I)alamin adenosyltransferase